MQPESYILSSEVAARERVDKKTVAAWIRAGIACRDGTRCRLKARKRGRAWVTTEADLDEFSKQLTEDALLPGPVTSTAAPVLR